MKRMLAVGLMSGTSLDGIDIALVEINQSGKSQLLKGLTYTYSALEKEKLQLLCSVRGANIVDVSAMNVYLGKKYGQLINQLIEQSGYQNKDIAFISSHGQTIYHQPYYLEKPLLVPNTFQIGDISVISEVTQIVVVGDFRPADMAAGGQGAPITSFVDYYLFQSDDKTRAVQNIGGIGNVTYLPKKGTEEDVLSFDTGPGNMMIDEAVYKLTKGKMTYDHNGEFALRGQIIQSLLNELMNHSYMKQSIPKTTGREMFGKHFVMEIINKYIDHPKEDIIHTMTEFTIQSIVNHYERYLIPYSPIDEVILGGGGAHNHYILKGLQEGLPETKIYLHEHFNMSTDFKEAIAFVYLGLFCLKGVPNTLPSATGARHSVVMGKISSTNQKLDKLIDLITKFEI